MKIPSLVVGLLYTLAFAVIQAGTDYFVTGDGASYALAAVIVAVLAAFGRWLQEQQTATITETTSVPTTVTTADGRSTVVRSRAAAVTVEPKNATRAALIG